MAFSSDEQGSYLYLALGTLLLHGGETHFTFGNDEWPALLRSAHKLTPTTRYK